MIAGELLPADGLLIGLRLVEIEPASGDSRSTPTSATTTRWARCTAASVRHRRQRDGDGYASTLEDGESFTTLELKINFCGRSSRPAVRGGDDRPARQDCGDDRVRGDDRRGG